MAVSRYRSWLVKELLPVWLPRAAIVLSIGAAVVYAGCQGVRFRHWMWDTTVPIRFQSDIERGYDWGRTAAVEGYANQYEKMRVQRPADQNWLDYGPLRLAVMTAWGRWSLTQFPHVRAWRRNQSFALTAPVLHFNLFMEIVGVVSAFFLTRLWAIRGMDTGQMDRRSLRWFFRGWIPGLWAALLLWFNPAIVLSAYGWPTWDLWIIPMFLLAALLASLNWWFTAGLIIGIGAMFKGQQLISLPVFIIWALLLGRPVSALRLCCGAVLAIALAVSPMLLTFIPADALAHAREIQSSCGEAAQAPIGTFQLARTLDWPAVIWVMGVLIAAVAMPVVSWITVEKPSQTTAVPPWRRMLASPWTWRALAAFGTFALVVWPWLIPRNRGGAGAGLLVGCAVAGLVLIIRPQGIGSFAAGLMGASLLMCMDLFHGSSAWYDCGIHFGTVHWPELFVGMTDNLPAILGRDFDWPIGDLNVTAFTIPAGLLLHYPLSAIDVSMRGVLQSLFWITFIPCALGVGMHARRRDPRVLIALTATWLMFFTFPPQIHERYLLFAGGISCICCGVNAGMALLGIGLSLVAFSMTLHTMLAGLGWGNFGMHQFSQLLGQQFPTLLGSNAGPTILRTLNGQHPDLGYAVILCAMVFLYNAVVPVSTRGCRNGARDDTLR